MQSSAGTSPDNIQYLTSGSHSLLIQVAEPSQQLDDLLITSDETLLPGSITGMLYLDSNGNGLRDGAESHGLANVPIALIDTAGNTVATSTTSVAGVFTFTNVVPGTYQVKLLFLPSYFVPTGPTEKMAVLPGFTDTVTAIDFGFVVPTAGTVAQFQATAVSGGVEIEWTTSGMDGASQYGVLRADDGEGPYEPVSEVLMFDDLPEGSTHRWLDSAADPGGTYWYELSLPDWDQVYGPILFTTPNQSYRVFLPQLRIYQN